MHQGRPEGRGFEREDHEVGLGDLWSLRCLSEFREETVSRELDLAVWGLGTGPWQRSNWVSLKGTGIDEITLERKCSTGMQSFRTRLVSTPILAWETEKRSDF